MNLNTEKNDFINKMNTYGGDKTPFLFIIDFDSIKPIIIPISEINPEEIIFQTEILDNFNRNEKQYPKEFTFEKFPISYTQYKKAFDRVMDNILSGNSYLLNLTFPTKVETTLTLMEILKYSKAKYKLYFKNQFICFSPEIFIKIIDGKIFSYPMKGTIDAAIENAEEIIMSDEKEFAEHNTIVDLIRNDLSIVSKKVRVSKFRYADYIRTNNKNLIQISSEICGELPKDWHHNIGNIFGKLLPAGSVTGAPKQKTVEIINQVEGYKRGYYTGIFGVFDGENIDSGVMIRYIENIDGELYFKSGGGITSQSNPEAEFQELIDKVYVPVF
ncbi:MAG: aminodeoxychorismate synthase component I [Candidatus Kapabacteria bacterium]|nr:aminodeoxychorismate synthase component I [Ignavibacteriota bacterium]MCW5884811.1 aminodeoxychorismate synthase component I [Candidatus Kapabacteria bacterium]